MFIKLIKKREEIIIMNRKRVLIFLPLLLVIGMICVIFSVNTSNTKKALKDKTNLIIYNYLKPHRKIMLLDFNTKKQLPVNFYPFYKCFSDRIFYQDEEIYGDFKIPDRTVSNKKISFLDITNSKLIYELKYKDGLCFSFFDYTEVKEDKSIYWFDYDEYKRLKSFREQYTYKDEIKDLRTYEYRYVYDLYSRTMFIFIIEGQDIKTVFYLKRNNEGYSISSFSDLLKNQEPSEFMHYNSANLIFENGLIKEIYEKHYNQSGVCNEEYLVKTEYDEGLKILEELCVKRKKDSKFKTVFKSEFQYQNQKISRITRINYDEWDRLNKQISQSISYNFIYDSKGNEISYDCLFENLNGEQIETKKWKVKKEIKYE